MNKTVTIQLSEAEYRNFVLCFTLGDLVKDSVEEKNKAETQAQIDLHQKVYKAAYEAKLRESGLNEGLYYYSRELEDKMLDIFDNFKEYVSSGQDARDTEEIRRQIDLWKKEEKRKGKI
jgi:hypothetical protein